MPQVSLNSFHLNTIFIGYTIFTAIFLLRTFIVSFITFRDLHDINIFFLFLSCSAISDFMFCSEAINSER